MLLDTKTDKVAQIATMILAANRTIAFTGAGISTDSGIPDFRSPESGLWEDQDVFQVGSIFGFKQNPAAFYNWVHPLAKTTLSAKPNPAHIALAELEDVGLISGVITQNIDMLHTRAGSKTIYELHGHLRESTCINCFTVFDAKPILEKFIEDGEVPRCSNCIDGVLKPNVILFGEQLPFQVLQDAQQAARYCDLMLIIGSSLAVAPASDLPLLAKQNGAKLVILNLEPTELDHYADIIIRGRAAELLPAVLREVEEQR